MGGRTPSNGTIYIIKAKQETTRDLAAACGRKSAAVKKIEAVLNGSHNLYDRSDRFAKNGASKIASLFTQQGRKGINQDAMLVLENFASRADTIFCGVFDGHGQDGHLVARNVRDILPLKLASCWQALHSAAIEPDLSPDGEEASYISQTESSFEVKDVRDSSLIHSWKESFMSAYKLMDRELLVDDQVDCICSGTTAVTLVKQGNDLIIGNVGDSRAVLGTTTEDHSLLALQLTVDLKPDLPKEAERISRFKGRVFALRDEPSVKRVWLPHQNTPGLAMARALGDYCLKNFGVISEPEVTYRRLTKKDKFVVLATDGVWDVLSNEQVVEIVDSAPARSLAAKAVVDTAVHVWRSAYPTSKVDDCAVVCLFLDYCGTI